MVKNTHSQNKNILLRGHGRLHAQVKDYLADDITVKVWIDKAKYAKRNKAPLTHDLNTFYRQLEIQNKTGSLSINYRYSEEFRGIYRELMEYANAFLYIYSRRPTLNGENNFMDMMDAFHIYIHFFINLLKTNDIHYVFFSTVPHHADYVLYLVAKALKIKTVVFFQSLEPGKAFMGTDINQLGSIDCDIKNIRPISIAQSKRRSYLYMRGSLKYRPCIKVISALLFRRDMGLTIHRLMNLRREMWFKRDYKKMVSDNLPDGKFVYFPLHLQPELTTQSLGGIFVDQILAIECLRALLPDEWKIVVKENPKQTAYSRGRLFFHRLSKIPGVVYVGKTLNTFDLLEKSEFCATITGTVGFEALAFGKQVLIFGQAVYKDLPGIIQYTDDLTLDNIMSRHFLHSELEIAYAKLVHNMVEVVIDADYIQLVDHFSEKKNTQMLANIINRVVRE